MYALTGLSFSVSWRGDYDARTFVEAIATIGGMGAAGKTPGAMGKTTLGAAGKTAGWSFSRWARSCR